jgi:hypothetical protein
MHWALCAIGPRTGRSIAESVGTRERLLRRDALRLLTFDALVDLFAMYGDLTRCVDADPNLIPFDTENGDGHFISDHQCFADATGEY